VGFAPKFDEGKTEPLFRMKFLAATAVDDK
jgi:hypothetical protein